MAQEEKERLVRAVSGNLKQLRRCCGLSQIDLAEKVGLTRQSLYAFETGQRAIGWQTCVALVVCFSLYEGGRGTLIKLGATLEDVFRAMWDSGCPELKQIFSQERGSRCLLNITSSI